MNRTKVFDTVLQKAIMTAKNATQAKQAIYRLERTDRRTGDFEPHRYIVIVTGHKADRQAKQARRAFELQEV